MSSSHSESKIVCRRYAEALFELAQDNKSLDTIEGDLQSLHQAILVSSELVDFLESPVYDRKTQENAVTTIAKKAKCQDLTISFLGVLAHNRRLGALHGIIHAFFDLMAKNRGEVTAKIKTAQPMTKAQEKDLAETLKKSIGSEVRLSFDIDESLLGGMVILMGSTMIDNSVKRKLADLHSVMQKHSNQNMSSQLKEVI